MQLADNVEGYLRASEISSNRVKGVHSVLREGETMTVMTINVDHKPRSINVSIKTKDSIGQQETTQKFSADANAAGVTNLGTLLKAKPNETNR